MKDAADSLYRDYISTKEEVEEFLRGVDFSCFSLPTPPNFDHSDFLVASSMDRIVSGDDMTVLIGAVSESGQVVLASDSRQWDKHGNSTDGLWKTLRINERCAVGFSGDVTYAGRIAANLMGVAELADREGDILKLIEESGIQMDQWKNCGAVLWVLRGILKGAAASVRVKGGKLPNIVFVGKDDDGLYLSEWYTPAKADPLSSTRNIFEKCPLKAHVSVFGPGTIKGCKCPKRIIKKTKVSFTDRVLSICELYAEQFPNEVNQDFTIRTDGTSFARMPLGTR